MKKKLQIPILIVAVIIVWGMLIYKIFTAVNANKTPKIISILPGTPGKLFSKTDTFTIHEYARDPFLDIFIDTATDVEEVLPLPPPPKKTLPKKLPEYRGRISSSQKEIAIFKAGSKYFMISRGDTFLGFRLRRLSADSAMLSFEGENFTLKCNKNGK